ncbi:pyridoxamine 5'-phosphate oxidase [Streptomyces agglomeratus]|uniref:Pyridoxamine 5'-phosphate oxidase n=1 Tax=Streptomyces agglomeratus TaxID=285458 RepID=A0A1E5PCW7_9ACTN|nr:pyridoxamine 5'-phosphate oxidase family protein [Streptomyces agglomeratus]OEJ27347.1 pyridoxamine 5'-phosphate oxidase [Streptomyces agglomeratus]OEJ38597.1 pyridoxamine 5'-phosphate oxidase [Streptomyces agglomeratus]OEJ47018.1 pyridoxamine 5'-phosphate oxidase [Streptomyces agglomeratus]OEJ51125.1 pyridoxamine 5'-phosphate oxidase [Streptomyces agglomeratus]OEJ58494.1 pyridoxamine 5'-phosphate oxidase [Streptomyces agglomeratus]
MTKSGWTEFEAAEPEFAVAVRQRFQQYRHHVLATIRKDGSPRVTGLEVTFVHGELWLGMMPNSRKAQDLRRGPRFAVQANPGPDDDMRDGDARISGRAVEVTDPEEIARFSGEVKPPEPFHLFRVEPTEVVTTSIEAETLVVRAWRPGRPVRTIRRGNSDEAAQEE